jgi:hypothetical protein
MLSTLSAWFAAHPMVKGALLALLAAVVGAFINWVTYKPTEADWAAYQLEHPRLALMIRICRAVFPHLRKIPAIAAWFPPDDPPKPPTAYRDPAPPSAPPSPPSAQREWRQLGRGFVIAAGILVLSIAGIGCSWFTPARGVAAADRADRSRVRRRCRRRDRGAEGGAEVRRDAEVRGAVTYAMKTAVIVLLAMAIGIVAASEVGCTWWDKRANDWVCPDHTLNCTCLDPKRHIGCQEPTDPNDPIFGPPQPMPYGVSPDGGIRDGSPSGDGADQ